MSLAAASCSAWNALVASAAASAPADADAGGGTAAAPRRGRRVDNIWAAAVAVREEQGLVGFTRGWSARAAQFAPAAMLFFAAFETFRSLLCGEPVALA